MGFNLAFKELINCVL